ncbi:hypothetical protein FACS1894170_03640 [Planctomycetales bacterium]|nr:hypothetical protein FACS1894170_03640 [Planctomycetales bacterium]
MAKLFPLSRFVLAIIFPVACISAIFIGGCQTPLAVKRIEAKNPLSKNSAKTPAKIVDVWNSCLQTTPEGQTIRGVAGSVHFYNNSKKKRAVKVDGDITVFVFDAKETDPAHAKPLKVYQFSADTLEKRHYSFKKPLGHGYNFFLPFDEIGGSAAAGTERALIVMTRFDDKLEGQMVIAPPVNTILNGTRVTPELKPTVQEFLASRSILSEANKTIAEEVTGVKQVNYLEEKQQLPETRNVSTIRLNNSMAKSLLLESKPVVTQATETTKD